MRSIVVRMSFADTGAVPNVGATIEGASSAGTWSSLIMICLTAAGFELAAELAAMMAFSKAAMTAGCELM